MQKVRLTTGPTRVVCEVQPDSTIDAIQDGNTIYIPLMTLAVGATVSPAPAPAGKSKPAPAPVADDSDDDDEDEDDADEAPATVKKYTVKELKAIDDKSALLAILEHYGVDPSETEGKNTAEKYRRLIIAAQDQVVANAGDDDDEEDEAPVAKKSAKAAPAKSKKAAPVEDDDDEEDEDDDEEEAPALDKKVSAILTKLDNAEINVKAAVTQLTKHGKADVNTGKLTALVSAFSKDADADLEETTAAVLALIADVPAKKAKAAPAAKSKKAAAPEPDDDDDDDDEAEEEADDDDAPEDVEASDLVKGDVVGVYWKKIKAWHGGVVKSVKKGVVTIAYDDDTEEVIDPAMHTKIVRYAPTEE